MTTDTQNAIARYRALMEYRRSLPDDMLWMLSAEVREARTALRTAIAEPILERTAA